MDNKIFDVMLYPLSFIRSRSKSLFLSPPGAREGWGDTKWVADSAHPSHVHVRAQRPNMELQERHLILLIEVLRVI